MFWRNSQEILESKSQKYDPQRPLDWGPIMGNFRELTRNHSHKVVVEIFFKASHQNWITWGNSLLFLHGFRQKEN